MVPPISHTYICLAVGMHNKLYYYKFYKRINQNLARSNCIHIDIEALTDGDIYMWYSIMITGKYRLVSKDYV